MVRQIRWRALLAVTSCLAVSGCRTAGQRYQDRDMDFGSIKTIAVLPFQNLSRDNLAADRVRDVFSSMLLATNAVYVVPSGEVVRGIGKVGVAAPMTPSVEDAQKLGTALKAEALITGVVKEYGEIRSGTASSNVISVSVQLIETATGKVVWAGATTKGGIRMTDRLFGGGGSPLNDVTEAAVDDLLAKMLK